MYEGSESSQEGHQRMIWIREGRLYRLLTPLAQVLVYIEVSPCELWHRICGHHHYKILPTLNSIVNGIPKWKEDHEGVCKGCALCKNTKRPFGSNASTSKEILDLIHSNVCGPMNPKSLGGHLFYVTFIDIIRGKLRLTQWNPRTKYSPNFKNSKLK